MIFFTFIIVLMPDTVTKSKKTFSVTDGNLVRWRKQGNGL